MKRSKYRKAAIPLFFAALFGMFANGTAAQPGRAAVPMLKDGAPAAYVLFTRPKQVRGLAMFNPEGITVEEDVFAGFIGITPGADSQEKAFYFKAATGEITATTGSFYVTLQYFNEGRSAVELDYRRQIEGQPEPVVHTERFFLTGSRFWERHTFALENAILDGGFANETDFRVRLPDVYIRGVAISRVPPRGGAGEPRFFQPAAAAPPGYSISVFPGGDDGGGMWDNPERLETKAMLYKAWGAEAVIDTVRVSADDDGRPDFSAHSKRAEGLAALGLAWTPRFKIGDLSALPQAVAGSLQPAMGRERAGTGPMASLWDPGLVRAYAALFNELRGAVPVRVDNLILSFAGDWGPLYLSSEQSETAGWPDVWTGDPLARRSLTQYLNNRYANTSALGSAWGVRVRGWEEALSAIRHGAPARAWTDLYEWYQGSLTQLAAAAVSAARGVFPRASIEIEIGDSFEYGATDFAAFAELAAQQNCPVVMVCQTPLPTESFAWQTLARKCRELNVPFGLRMTETASSAAVLGHLYSLASEGGTRFQFNEDALAAENAWTLYANALQTLGNAAPQRNLAVPLPRHSLFENGAEEFGSMIRSLRERVAFDIVDERDLGRISAADYPMLLVPMGNVWSAGALADIENLVRAGSALVVRTEEPWRDLSGNLEINERLFAGRIVRDGDRLRIEARGDEPAALSETDPHAPAASRTLELGAVGDEPYLSGKWSAPQGEAAAGRYGFNFDSFRWFRDRGIVTLPMIPGEEYNLSVEGFLPQGRDVDVHLNGRPFGRIEGKGLVRWSKPVTGEWRPREKDVQVILRGQEWSPGFVLGATERFRVTMAVGKIAMTPLRPGAGVRNADTPPRAPEFRRELLRGTLMREVGRGVTLLAPESAANEWMFYELVSALAQRPRILDPRFRFSEPPDGERNRVYVSPLAGVNAYLNLNAEPVEVGGRFGPRRYAVPPHSIYYAF